MTEFSTVSNICVTKPVCKRLPGHSCRQIRPQAGDIGDRGLRSTLR